MNARINETVLESFRIDEESLRDLDAVVRQRAGEFVSEPILTYEVIRGDNFTYPTTGIEIVLQERNGVETSIRALSLKVEHGDDLTLSVIFDDSGVRFEAESSDRARLVLLVGDLRSLMRDRMAGRRTSERRRVIGEVAPYLAPAITFLSLVALGARNSSVLSERHQQASRDYEEEINRQLEADGAQMVEENEVARKEGLRLLEDGTEEEKLDFLIEQSTNLPSDASAYVAYPSTSYPEYPSSPWFFSPLSIIFLPILAWLLTLFVRRLLVPRAEHLFLIGDEVKRQTKLEKRRELVVWGIGVAFAVSVVASLAVNAIP